MAIDTSGLDKALGAIGTTFRLTRLYPPTHPAVQEGLRQIAAGLPALAALGTVEWKIGATGLHWHGQHLLARNTQVAELAGLLYARGVRAIQVNPGVTPEQCLALFGVAIGTIGPDDATLGRITLMLGRRASQRMSAGRAAPVPEPPPPSPPPPPPAPPAPAPATDATPAPAQLAPPPPPPPPPAPQPPAAETVGPGRASPVFRPHVLPPDLEAKRAVAGLLAARTIEEQRSRVEQLRGLTAALLALRDIGAIAEIIAGLDRALIEVQDPVAQEGIGDIAVALTDDVVVERMVARLGEARVPPAERVHLVNAVGALAAVAAGPVVDAYVNAPAELREAYRAAMRAAGERALETLQNRLASKVPEVAAAAAEFLGLTGSPQAVQLLIGISRHSDERVREAALLGLAELGGREVSRPAMPALKDESVLVRMAAARAIAAAGDGGATTVLVRRLEQEADEGVLAALLKAIGQLGAKEALEILAKHAEPGGRPRRTPYVRATAVEGLARLDRPEARALLELYARDKEPTVKRAAEASLR
jgi:HEAT repeat protein